MKCRPVTMSGKKYEDEFDLVHDDPKRKAKDAIKRVWSPNKFFGFSFVVLVLMILLVPISTYYLVNAK